MTPECELYMVLFVVILFQFAMIAHEMVDRTLVNFIVYPLHSILDTAILLLPCLFMRMRWARRYGWTVVALFSVWAIAQVLYFRVYKDLMPFTAWLLTENVNGLLVNSIVGLLKPIDSLMLIVPVGEYVWYRKRLRKRIDAEKKIGKRVALQAIVGIVMLAALSLGANLYSTHYEDVVLNGRRNFMEFTIWRKYTIFYQKKEYFIDNGFFVLAGYSAYDTWKEAKPLTGEEKAQIDGFLLHSCPHYTDNRFAVQGRKNLIFIIVESLNSWAVNFEIDGRKVAPTLSALCTADSSITALRVQPQVKYGHSSDAHFIYNTGLLPVNSGVVTISYCDLPYPSLAKALKGYNAVEIVCDEATFWNQNHTAKSYGFSRLYDKNDMQAELKKWHNYSDGALIDEARRLIPRLRQPFFAQMVTLSMHQPYDKAETPPTWISQSRQYTPEVLNYLERVHFLDCKIGEFIRFLKQRGLYANSVIAIASDHNNMDWNYVQRRADVRPSDKEVALFIMNTRQTLHHDYIVGQVDVFPTLLDVMGANAYGWKGLGHSLLRQPRVESATLWTGAVEGNNRSPLARQQQRTWIISNLMVTKNYFGGGKK